MTDEQDQIERELRFIEEMIDEHDRVAGDIVEIGIHTWAIHGSIGVDGDVIMAEFESFEDARSVLDRLGPNQPGA